MDGDEAMLECNRIHTNILSDLNGLKTRKSEGHKNNWRDLGIVGILREARPERGCVGGQPQRAEIFSR